METSNRLLGGQRHKHARTNSVHFGRLLLAHLQLPWRHRKLLIWTYLLTSIYMTTCQQETVCPVTTTAAFIESLTDTKCDVVEISGKGFVLSQREMSMALAEQPENRVTLDHNLTVRGETNETILDLAYLKRRILLGTNVVLNIERLVLAHPRQPSAYSQAGLDIISMADSTTLRLEDATIVYGLCAPMESSVRYGHLVPRPPGFPGNQTFALLGRTCVPGLVALTASSPAPIARDCYSEAYYMQDYAMSGNRLDPQGQIRLKDVGAVYYIRTTYVCEHTPAPMCVQNASINLVYCINAAINASDLGKWELYDLHLSDGDGGGGDGSGGSGGGGSGGSGSSSVPILAIVLPCVLGGIAVIGIVIGAAWLWQRRSRRRRAAAAAAAAAATAAAGKRAAGASMSGRSTPGGRSAAAASAAASVDVGAVGADGVLVSVADGEGRMGSTGARGPGSASWTDGIKWASNSAGNGNGVVYRCGTMSSVQSASMNGTAINLMGLGAGGAVVSGVDSSLDNPLLHPYPGGQTGGSPLGSGTGISLNMVLGVDVFASREAVVGRGTFATVLEGHLAGRPVAVKMFHRDALGSTQDDVKSLKQEIAILARCQHPNVVALLGAGSTTGGDEVFLVEELMVSNLARVCHEGEGLSLPRVLSVARDIASGLAYLHPTVIHRDLKPANVLLDQCGNAKLTDFGLSRLWASTVHTANPEAGTVQYMAPECFSGSLNVAAPEKTAISHLSDMYSFGVMLWEMLAKERPWRGMTSIQVALAVGYEQQRLKVPEDSDRFHPKIRKLILQCWDADPRKRPGAAEVAKRLSLMLQQIEAHGSLNNPSASAAGSFSGEPYGRNSLPVPVSSGSLGSPSSGHPPALQALALPPLGGGCSAAGPVSPVAGVAGRGSMTVPGLESLGESAASGSGSGLSGAAVMAAARAKTRAAAPSSLAEVPDDDC